MKEKCKVPTAVLTKETNEIQRVHTLKNNRQKRHHYQEFVIEGHAAIDQACEMGWDIEAFFYNKDIPLSDWAKSHLEGTPSKATFAISEELMSKLSEKTDSSELIATAKMRVKHFSAYQPKAHDVIVVLDEPNSPGNLGMIIRSAAAFGASAVVLSGHAADEYDPKCIRASVGTFFALPLYHIEGIRAFSEIIETLKGNLEVRIVASGNQGSISMKQASFTADVLFLILGNETCGVSRGYRHIADEFVQIPLSGKFTSLNIAAAASVFLYEIFQRR